MEAQRDDTFLSAPDGTKFFLSPPTGNDQFQIPGKTQMEGDLVFLGRLPIVDHVTLTFNGKNGDLGDTALSPKIDVPITLPKAAFTDAGVKKLTSTAEFAPVPTSTSTVIPLAASMMVASGLAASKGQGSALLTSALKGEETPEGLRIKLSGDILFDFDKATIRASALPTLHQLALLIESEQPPSVAIEGHADSMGDDYNQRLGLERAQSVKDWLAGQSGLDAGKLEAASFGETRPAAPNANPDGSDNPAGRQLNRRVEVLLRK